jgi:hypothetical protein
LHPQACLRFKTVAILIEDKVTAFVGVRRFLVKEAFFLLFDAAGGADRDKALLTIASVFSLHLEHLLPVEPGSVIAGKTWRLPVTLRSRNHATAPFFTNQINSVR